ncbi:MAG: hypothetical protein PHN89_05205 [Candidatus Pacebacteria bacterium]|nr:hypothetical protein [Candidatus Paceibacterota bacterium]MDD5222396.1 hypothetical protein [bacterium]
MNRQRLEAWALEIIDTVKSKRKVEDSNVELKTNWPDDPYKAARRLAGHANAARGENILWIIGLGEEKGISKYDKVEIANWWTQVKNCFDGLAPSLIDYVLSTSDGPVQLLYFETSSSPFLVKNPNFGKENAGPIEREIPWREGTKVRSATREDLIRILVPLIPLPDVELLEGNIYVSKQNALDPNWIHNVSRVRLIPHLSWQLQISLYIIPNNNQRIVFPVHRTQLKIHLEKCEDSEFIAEDITFSSSSSFPEATYHSDLVSILTTSSEAIIHLPGRLEINASYYEPLKKIPSEKNLEVQLVIKPTGTEHSIEKYISFIEKKIDEGSKEWIMNGNKRTKGSDIEILDL